MGLNVTDYSLIATIGLILYLAWRIIGLRDSLQKAEADAWDCSNRAAAFRQQANMLGEQLVAYDEMKHQIDIIALWMRDSCKAQIAAGLHKDRGIGEVAVAYLSGQMPGSPLPVASQPSSK
jgi:hypothetical protein